jgi:hypothetical protein
LLKGVSHVIPPRALRIIEVLETVMKLAQPRELMTTEQERHVEKRDRCIASVADKIDEWAARRGHLMAFDDIDMIQRTRQRGALSPHNVAVIEAELRTPL